MSKDPRVAVLTPYGAAHQVGGVEVFNECLRRAFGGLEIFADGRPNAPNGFADLHKIGLEQPYRALRAARALIRRHRDEPFDVIVSNGLSGWPLTLVKPNVPMIQVYHFTLAGLARSALSRRSDRWTTGHVTAAFDRFAGVGKHVVAVSHRVLHEVEMFYGLRGRCIPNAVDTQAFRPMDRTRAREALGLPIEGAIGIFVGRSDPTKGYDILVRVARRMPHVLFLVAGGQASSVGNIRSLGRIAHDEMPLWYAASDFFVLPSRYEGFGLSLLEALACNLPAVVSRSAWPFAEEPRRCGIVVGGDSDEDFARAISMALSSRTEFSSRDFIVPRYDLVKFQQEWRGFVQLVLDVGG